MKVLLVTFWSDINFSGKEKFVVLDEKGEITNVEYEGMNEALAEYEFLKNNRIDVKLVVVVPSTLSRLLSDLPNDYESLIKSISNEVKNRVPQADYIFVLPSEGAIRNIVHEEGLGNFHFFFYYRLYEVLIKEVPDVLLLDVSRAFSYYQAYAISATQLAIDDFLMSTGKSNILYIQFVNVNNVLKPILVKDVNNVDISKYLTSNLRLYKEKGFGTPGKSELYGIGKALQMGFPLALLCIIRNIENGKLISPYEFEKSILSSINISKGEKYEVKATTEAHVTAPYYFIGYHFVNKYKDLVSGDTTLEVLESILNLFSEPQKNLIKREIELIKDFSKLPKEEGEYLLDYLVKLGNTRLLDVVKGNVVEEENEECEIDENELISHAGLGRKFTKVIIKGGKIIVKCAESCEDEVLSWVKNLGKK